MGSISSGGVSPIAPEPTALPPTVAPVTGARLMGGHRISASNLSSSSFSAAASALATPSTGASPARSLSGRSTGVDAKSAAEQLKQLEGSSQPSGTSPSNSNKIFRAFLIGIVVTVLVAAILFTGGGLTLAFMVGTVTAIGLTDSLKPKPSGPHLEVPSSTEQTAKNAAPSLPETTPTTAPTRRGPALPAGQKPALPEKPRPSGANVEALRKEREARAAKSPGPHRPPPPLSPEQREGLNNERDKS